MIGTSMHAVPAARGSRVLSLLALACLLAILDAPTGAEAATVSIGSLYTTSAAAATAWSANDQAVPPAVSTFATGTNAVAADFAYSGARAYSGAQFQLEILAQSGAVVAKSPFHLFVRASGRYALVAYHGPAGHPDGLPYPDGTYRAAIVVDGKGAAGVPFTVGVTQAVASPTRSSKAMPAATATARPATPTPQPVTRAAATPVPAAPTPAQQVMDRIVPGKGLLRFYITSLAAANAWSQDHAQLPPHIDSFAAGTTSVAGYFAYASPSLLDGTYQMSIRDAAGAVVSTSTFFVFLHTQGAAALVGTHGMAGATVLSDNKPFAPGRYQAQLRFSTSGVVGVATFAVRP